MNQETFVGIDVCQSYLDVHIAPQGKSYRLENNLSGVEELVTRLKAVAPELVVLESTGGLERLVVGKLQAAQISVALVNPRKVRAYATALGKAKTDSLDALVLADFAKSIRPSPQQQIDESDQRLVDLVTRRRQLVEGRVAEKNRLSRAPKSVKEDIEDHIEYLDERIKILDQEIKQLTQQSQFVDKQKILMSVPGMGPATSAVCLAELPELGTLTEKKIARLVGVAPINRDSGQHRGKRMIEGGRAHVRAALYMATLVATRHNPIIRQFYQRLLARGKLKKVALTACLRKLLIILNAMIRDASLWREQTSSSS